MRYKKILTEVQQNIQTSTSDEKELTEYKEDFIDMNIGSLKSIATNAKSILDSLSDPNVKKNLTASWLQGKIAVTEENMKTIHDYVKFTPADDDKSVAGCGCGKKKPVKNPPIDPAQQQGGKNTAPAKAEEDKK